MDTPNKVILDLDDFNNDEQQGADLNDDTSSEGSPQPGTSKEADIDVVPVHSAPSHFARNVCPNTCQICGDVSTGYHYEVPSCNGCKTFFRRTVLCQLKYKCKGTGDCGKLINKQRRVKCRSCRFDLCVEKGMNPFSIQTERSPGTNPVIKLILAKRKMAVTSADSSKHEAPQSKVMVHLSSAEATIERLIDNLLYLEVKSDRLRQSTYSPKFHTDSLEDVILGKPNMGLTFPDFISVEERLKRTTSFEEYVRLPLAKCWLLNDAVCVIEYMKTFSFYHKLGDNDKRLLVKDVAISCSHLTRAFYSYDHKSDIVFYPDGTVTLGGRPPETKYDHLMARGVIAPFIQLSVDRKEYVLLKAIFACNDLVAGLSPHAKRLLSEERARYAKSLMQYVMNRRGPVAGPGVFAGLIALIDTFTHVTTKHKEHHILRTFLGDYKCPIMDDLCKD